jgi:hypothetical protein
VPSAASSGLWSVAALCSTCTFRRTPALYTWSSAEYLEALAAGAIGGAEADGGVFTATRGLRVRDGADGVAAAVGPLANGAGTDGGVFTAARGLDSRKDVGGRVAGAV